LRPKATAARPSANPPVAPLPTAAPDAAPATVESLGQQLREVLPTRRLQSVSLCDHEANVLWLSEGALGPDEHSLVLDALEVLAADPSLPCHETGLEDGRLAVFLPVRAPTGRLVGAAMILADSKSVGDDTLERMTAAPVRTIMQRLAVLLKPAGTGAIAEVPLVELDLDAEPVLELEPAGDAPEAVAEEATEAPAPVSSAPPVVSAPPPAVARPVVAPAPAPAARERAAPAPARIVPVAVPAPVSAPARPNPPAPARPPVAPPVARPVEPPVSEAEDPADDTGERVMSSEEVNEILEVLELQLDPGEPITVTPARPGARAAAAPEPEASEEGTVGEGSDMVSLEFMPEPPVVNAAPSPPAPVRKPRPVGPLPPPKTTITSLNPDPPITLFGEPSRAPEPESEITLFPDKPLPWPPAPAPSAPASTAPPSAPPAVTAAPRAGARAGAPVRAAAVRQAAPKPPVQTPPAPPASRAAPRVVQPAAPASATAPVSATPAQPPTPPLTIAPPRVLAPNPVPVAAPRPAVTSAPARPAAAVPAAVPAAAAAAAPPAVVPAAVPAPAPTPAAAPVAADTGLDVLPFAKLRAGGQMRRYQVQVRPAAGPRDPAALDAHVLQRLLPWLSANRTAWNSQPTGFTVNLSVATLEDERFTQRIAATLNEHGVAGETIGFEIAEALCVQRRAQVERFLSQCEKLGTWVAIDDFSFDSQVTPLLRSRALRLVKIDPRLTTTALRDKFSQAVVVATVQAAKVLGIHCAAKKVDSPASLQWLTAIGLDFAQGAALARSHALEMLLDPTAGRAAAAVESE
jgi:EAL domain-containing protein (putative c-di-GMP-specific phosphodiesterase class I)